MGKTGGTGMKFELPKPVEKALTRLEDAGYPAYAVGGCVRDWALGMTPHDFDVCTAARPEETEQVFREERIVETGVRHGTVTVILDNMPLEITTFRLDGDYLDGRHPASVRFTDQVEEDLARRDFTINAMAYSPVRGLKDPFGGREDCRKGIVRCVGEAETRFGEDALRILRALRFSARLGFPIEEKTARAARTGKDMLAKVSRERIAAELTGLLLGEKAGETLTAFPEVVCAAAPVRALTESGAWTLAAHRVDLCPREGDLRWAALLMDLGETEAKDVLRSLKMPTKTVETAGTLAAWSQTPVEDAPVLEWLARLGPERTDLFFLLQTADRIARKPENEADHQARLSAWQAQAHALVRENACFTVSRLAVDGYALAGLGLRGREIGDALHALLLRVVRGEIRNDRDALLAAVRQRTAERGK